MIGQESGEVRGLAAVGPGDCCSKLTKGVPVSSVMDSVERPAVIVRQVITTVG